MSSQFLPPGTEWSREENVKDDKKRAGFVLAPKDWLIASRTPTIAVKTFQGDAAVVVGFTTAGSCKFLLPILQGKEEGQRVGRRINLKQIKIKAIIQPDTTGTVATDVRLMYALVYDRYPKGTPLTFNNVFTDVFGAATQNPLTPQNPDNDARFLVLYRRNIQMPHFLVTGGVANNTTYLDPIASNSLVCITVDLQLLATVFNKGAAATGVIADVNTGSLYWITSSSVASAYHHQGMGWQVQFTDV